MAFTFYHTIVRQAPQPRAVARTVSGIKFLAFPFHQATRCNRAVAGDVKEINIPNFFNYFIIRLESILEEESAFKSLIDKFEEFLPHRNPRFKN